MLEGRKRFCKTGDHQKLERFLGSYQFGACSPAAGISRIERARAETQKSEEFFDRQLLSGQFKMLISEHFQRSPARKSCGKLVGHDAIGAQRWSGHFEGPSQDWNPVERVIMVHSHHDINMDLSSRRM